VNKAVGCVRVALGLIFLVYGVNGFITFMPVPPLARAADDFVQALLATGYMVYLWKQFFPEPISRLLARKAILEEMRGQGT
jgi:hypothetical protein